jgi:erythromycin esterase-like protein
MPPAAPDDYATFLAASGAPRLIVPLRAPLPFWLAAPHRIRFAGSNVAAANRPMVEATVELARKFDAVIWLETSTPTQVR